MIDWLSFIFGAVSAVAGIAILLFGVAVSAYQKKAKSGTGAKK